MDRIVFQPFWWNRSSFCLFPSSLRELFPSSELLESKMSLAVFAQFASMNKENKNMHPITALTIILHTMKFNDLVMIVKLAAVNVKDLRLKNYDSRCTAKGRVLSNKSALQFHAFTINNCIRCWCEKEKRHWEDWSLDDAWRDSLNSE